MKTPEFFVGLHHPNTADRFTAACITIATLRKRRKPLGPCRVLIDSGAYTVLTKHGDFPQTVEEYAKELMRLHGAGIVTIAAAASQDWICAPQLLAKTGKTVLEHQWLTIERYDHLVAYLERAYGGTIPFHIMPVLQGQTGEDFVRHIRMYGHRLHNRMWVGVGSIKPISTVPDKVARILGAIRVERPDLRLHGFGLKTKALKHPEVRGMLHSADSSSWSYAARRQGRNQHDWREAESYVATLNAIPQQPWQEPLL